MVRRNVYFGKSDVVQSFQTPHQGEINQQHCAVKLGDTWWEVAVPQVNPNGSAITIDQTDGEKSTGGAEAIGDELCASTKTDIEVLVWADAYKTEHTSYDISHNNCVHFCVAFVKWASEGKCDLNKQMSGAANDDDDDLEEGAPEQESALGDFFKKMTKAAAKVVYETLEEQEQKGE